MIPTAPLGALALGLALAGCSGDRVRLASEDGSVVLSYRCGDPAPAAGSPAERALLKEYATLVGRDANANGRLRLLDPILASYAAEDYDSLEAQVVRYACEFGDVRAAVRAAERPPVFPQPGSEARPFELPLLTAERGPGEPYVSPTERFRMEEARGSIVVLNFWATWCSPCVDKHPEMVRLAAKYRDRGVRFYGIVHQESPESVAGWLRGHGGPGDIRMLVDRGDRVARLFGIRGVPQTFVVGRDGRMVQKIVGHFAGLDAELDALVREGA
jgi:thiol-disulfide isomerase/thioredoxin